MPEINSKEIILTGIGASPGICIGKAYLVYKEGVEVIGKYPIEAADIKKEVKRFKAAVKKARDELRTIIENTPEGFLTPTSILETQEVLLKDKMLYGKTIETIQSESVNAEWALKKVVAGAREAFQAMSDSYLKERVTDIVHLSERIMHNLVGAVGVDIGKIDKRVILVAPDLSPAETSQIQLERIKGFVTDKGGKASHTGILARSLEIPAVLGLTKATAAIKNEDLMIVDGSSGIVIINPDEQTLLEYEERRGQYEERKAAFSSRSQAPAETLDKQRIAVLGNIERSEQVASVLSYGGEGIGLYRTEFQYMGRVDFPTEEELYEKYLEVVEVAAPRPVTIRTLDINGDKYIAAQTGHEEQNPALGLRGIRYCLHRPEVFRTQLRAILRAAAHGNVSVMFPMVATLDEVLAAKESVQEAAASLVQEDIAHSDRIRVGVLVEVPSAVVMADVLADEVDFFSVGTNDLIQYSLAIDRGNEKVAHLFRPLDPAILRMLKRITDVAREKGVEVLICGEMAGYPIHIPILMGMGMDGLSINPLSIPPVKHMIRSIRMEETGAVAAEALKLHSAEKVFQMLQSTYKDVLEEIGQQK
jgi:phosphotransferase system enzyme I (PtsI)